MFDLKSKSREVSERDYCVLEDDAGKSIGAHYVYVTKVA